MRITFRFHYCRNSTLRKQEMRGGLYQGLCQMCSERRSELTVKCVVNGVFLAVLLAKVVFRGILRAVSKLTAEMPMRYAWYDACRKHHRSVETNDAWWRLFTQAPGPTRMPAFFYRRISIRMIMTIAMTAIPMPIGFHLLSRPSRDTGLRPMTQRHSAVSKGNILRFWRLSS